MILTQIRNQISQDYEPETNDRLLSQKRAAALSEALSTLAMQQENLEKFERVLKRAQQTYPVREDNEFYTLSAPYALIRYALLELGFRLAERDVIRQGDDVFYLELEEARSALITGDQPTTRSNLFKQVRHRRAQRAWAQANPAPPDYGLEPPQPASFDFLPSEARLSTEALTWSLDRIFEPQKSQTQQAAREQLRGLAASAGQYIGPVRVIMNEGEFDKLQPGDVLVCPITSPVWSLIFPKVGALVTDSGGILSHPAIIAREYQIPAVVALGNATSLLKDGQTVKVDGSYGTVTVHN